MKDRNAHSLKRAQEQPFALIEALTPEQATAYGMYQNQILVEINALRSRAGGTLLS